MRKEKQIEEMASDIEQSGMLDSLSRCRIVAEELYFKGYRKQIEWIAKKPPEKYRDEDGDLELFIAYSSKHDCMALAIFNGDRWYLGPHELDDVDYWMPLPEPPKGD